MSGEMSHDEEVAFLKAKTDGQQVQIVALENALAVQDTLVNTQTALITQMINAFAAIGNNRAVKHDDEIAQMEMALVKLGGSKSKKEPSQKKDSKPKKQMKSISLEENLKSLLKAKAPSSILLANIPREYKVAFGDSHPLMKPENEKLGKYLERFEFISFDTSEQTDGTGPVWVSLKDACD